LRGAAPVFDAAAADDDDDDDDFCVEEFDGVDTDDAFVLADDDELVDGGGVPVT
jgi:hypothetical protein